VTRSVCSFVAAGYRDARRDVLPGLILDGRSGFTTPTQNGWLVVLDSGLVVARSSRRLKRLRQPGSVALAARRPNVIGH
jgi:hypothetical protein